MATQPQAARLEATGWIREMNSSNESGGSEPHLFSTAGGRFMVKTSNNPQGARVLVNELVGGLCLDWLGVAHPKTAVIDIPEDVIIDSPGAKFKNGTVLAHGLAFGSEYWQSDAGGVVSVSLIVNHVDAAGTLAFDSWVKQFDGRQYRARRSSQNPGKYEFIPVDQGFSFGGPNWDAGTLAADLADVGVPGPPVALSRVDLEPLISRLRMFGQTDAEQIVGQVPPSWLGPVERTALINYLVTRAPRAADALETAYPRP